MGRDIVSLRVVDRAGSRSHGVPRNKTTPAPGRPASVMHSRCYRLPTLRTPPAASRWSGGD